MPRRFATPPFRQTNSSTRSAFDVACGCAHPCPCSNDRYFAHGRPAHALLRAGRSPRAARAHLDAPFHAAGLGVAVRPPARAAGRPRVRLLRRARPRGSRTTRSSSSAGCSRGAGSAPGIPAAAAVADRRSGTSSSSRDFPTAAAGRRGRRAPRGRADRAAGAGRHAGGRPATSAGRRCSCRSCCSSSSCSWAGSLGSARRRPCTCATSRTSSRSALIALLPDAGLLRPSGFRSGTTGYSSSTR